MIVKPETWYRAYWFLWTVGVLATTRYWLIPALAREIAKAIGKR